LNNDTWLTPGWAPPLLHALHSEPALGAVGPLLLYADGTVQHLGVAMGAFGPVHLYQGFPQTHSVVRRKRDLQFITGAAMMIAKDLFFCCGGFYEEYQNGFEDIELSTRVREQGKKLRCEPDSVIYHLEGQTPGRGCNEENNSALLTERCRDSCYADLHCHGIHDGFSVFIDDMLDIGLRLDERDERNLAEQAEKSDLDAWQRLSLENPLWVYGREVLAGKLEQAGKFDEAMSFRLSLVEIEPLLGRYLDITRLLPKYSGAKDWLPTFNSHLKIITRFKSDVNATKAQIDFIRQHRMQSGDFLLEQAYRNKVQQMFPENG
jgi:hypothetical protein